MLYIENKPCVVTAYQFQGTDKIDGDMKVFLDTFKRYYYFEDGNMYIRDIHKHTDKIVSIGDYIVLSGRELRVLPEDIFCEKYKKYTEE